MQWPRHFTHVYHSPSSPHPQAFPFKTGTYECPPNFKVTFTQSLSHSFIRRFSLDSEEKVEMQQTYLRLLDATASRDYSSIKEMTTPDLCVVLQRDLEGLHAHGYRLQLKHPWDGIIEFKIYAYGQNFGLSPGVGHNYPAQEYAVDVVYMGLYPLKYTFRLMKPELTQETGLVIREGDPLSLAGLTRESPRLRELLRTYPIQITELYIGFLSQRKFHISDLYAKQKVVSGESDTDEYEFHLLKFQKAYPADQPRFERSAEYRRFIDANFDRETHRWLVADIDQSYGLGLLPRD